MELRIKGRTVIINFNILLLKKNKAVLEMPSLRKYNLRSEERRVGKECW